MLPERGHLEVQAHALNAHDLESALTQWTPHAHVWSDGRPMGEGPRAVRRFLEAEYGHYARLGDLDGEPVLVEYGPDGEGPAEGVLRFEEEFGRLTACHVEHDPRLLRRVQAVS